MGWVSTTIEVKSKKLKVMIDKNTIYSYFQTDDFPTEDQFRATWDSFWHKSESIPMSSITGLNQLFQQAATVAQLNNKANVDGSNIDVSAYQEKLNITNLIATAKEEVKTELLNGAPEAFDTLKEISDWISDDETAEGAILQAIQNEATARTNADNQKLDKGTYTGTAQDLFNRFEGKIEAGYNYIPKVGNGASGKVLTNSVISEIYGKIGINLPSEASEKLEVGGRIKSDGQVFNETTSAILPKEIKFKDGKFKAALSDGVEKSIAFEGESESDLLFSYIHTTNISLQPTSVNYSTGHITVNNHGLSFSGQKLIGLFNNNFSLADPISNLKYNAPEEWLSSNLYIKIIDTNTLMICNSSGGLISASIGTGNNKNLDFSNWHLEIIDTSTKPCVINDLNNCRIEIRGVAFAGNIAGALRHILFQNHEAKIILIEFGQFAGTQTKQNILFNSFLNTFFKGRYRNFMGFENSKYLLYGSQDYTYDQTVYAKGSAMITNSNDYGVKTFSNNFLGNGSTIEIYKS